MNDGQGFNSSRYRLWVFGLFYLNCLIGAMLLGRVYDGRYESPLLYSVVGVLFLLVGFVSYLYMIRHRKLKHASEIITKVASSSSEIQQRVSKWDDDEEVGEGSAFPLSGIQYVRHFSFAFALTAILLLGHALLTIFG